MRAPGVRRSSGVAAYAALLIVGVLDTAAYSIIAPVVPALADETGAGPALIGVLVAAFGLGMAAGFALAGRVVERTNASYALALGLGLSAVGAVGFVVGGSFVVYLVARLLMGIGSGGLWLGATFAILERWPGAEYRRLTGLISACALGGIAGPAFGALGGIRTPFVAYLALLLATALALFWIGVPAQRASFSSDRAPLRQPAFWLACAGILLVAGALGVVDGPLPLHFGERLSQAEIAGLYLAASVVLAASAAFAGAFAPRPLLVAGTALMVLGPALAGATDVVALWFVALALAAIGFGIGEAGALGVLLEVGGVDRIVLALVIWSQVWAVGYLVGPAAGGAVAETLGFAALGLVPLVGALVVAAAFVRAPRPVAAEVGL